MLNWGFTEVVIMSTTQMNIFTKSTKFDVKLVDGV
jgi:hypothetical protein